MFSIRSRFESRPLNEEDKLRASQVRDKFVELAEYLSSNLQDSREKALVITKLEEACMWSIKSISNEVKLPWNHD